MRSPQRKGLHPAWHLTESHTPGCAHCSVRGSTLPGTSLRATHLDALTAASGAQPCLALSGRCTPECAHGSVQLLQSSYQLTQVSVFQNTSTIGTAAQYKYRDEKQRYSAYFIVCSWSLLPSGGLLLSRGYLLQSREPSLSATHRALWAGALRVWVLLCSMWLPPPQVAAPLHRCRKARRQGHPV